MMLNSSCIDTEIVSDVPATLFQFEIKAVSDQSSSAHTVNNEMPPVLESGSSLIIDGEHKPWNSNSISQNKQLIVTPDNEDANRLKKYKAIDTGNIHGNFKKEKDMHQVIKEKGPLQIITNELKLEKPGYDGTVDNNKGSNS